MVPNNVIVNLKSTISRDTIIAMSIKIDAIINKNLEFHYKNLGEDVIDDAYETLILDVFEGNTMLFSRSDFVEKAWEIVDPIINEIDKNNIKLYGYKAGTWGPTKCNDLFRNENTWRYPCKNLVNDGEICEL